MNRKQRRHPSAIEFRAVTLDNLATRIDADDPTGRFGGYANLHGITDSYGTRFRAGAWRTGTPDLERPTALLWMHDPTNPVGVFSARDDDQGLWIEGTFDATDEGQRARARAISGSAPELSVGFVRLANDPDDGTEIVSSRLVETSLITARMASQPGAQLTSVRSQLAGAGETRSWPAVAGSYEDRTYKLSEAATAWAASRFGSPDDNDYWVSIEATFDTTVIVSVHNYADGSRTFYEFDYEMTADGVVLGEPREVDVVAHVQRVADVIDIEQRRRLKGLGLRLRLGGVDITRP